MDTVKTFKKEMKNVFAPLEEKDLETIHRIVLGMFHDFVSFCEKNSLTYYLTGGSALGAIRHNGFIPWDDDMDIVMPRKDYNFFRDTFEKEYGDKYSLEGPCTKHVSAMQFLKLRKKGTKLRGLMSLGPEYGVFIDIFALDYAPDSAIHRWFCNAGYFILKSLHYSIAFYRLYDTVFKKYEKDCRPALRRNMKLKKAWGHILSIVPLEKWMAHFDKMVQKKPSNYYVVPGGIHNYKNECFPVDVFYPPRKADFEDLKVNIPNKAEVILQTFYGDYMTPVKSVTFPLKRFLEVDFGEEK